MLGPNAPDCVAVPALVNDVAETTKGDPYAQRRVPASRRRWASSTSPLTLLPGVAPRPQPRPSLPCPRGLQ